MFIQLNARTYNLLQFHAIEPVGVTIELYTISRVNPPLLLVSETITYPSTEERDIDMRRINQLINQNQIS